ncbi:hypothetical protein ACM6XU_004794, partial [Vibrio parahaemolyticus]
PVSWCLTPQSPSPCNDAPIWRVDTLVFIGSTLSQRLAGYCRRHWLTPLAANQSKRRLQSGHDGRVSRHGRRHQ